MEKMTFKQRFERGKSVRCAYSYGKDAPGTGNRSRPNVFEEQQGFRGNQKESHSSRWQRRGRADNLGHVTLHNNKNGKQEKKSIEIKYVSVIRTLNLIKCM